MGGNETAKVSDLSRAGTPEEIGEFWDSHSLADLPDGAEDVQFEVRARQRRRVTLDPDLYEQVGAQARIRGISPETLVNRWLTERLKSGEARS